jgi:hypothetical protein
MTITIRNGTNECQSSIRFGNIQTQATDGDIVSYQAGGVWRMTDAGAIMVSPPNMQYSNGTFNFQLINVTSNSAGPIEKLTVTKNASQSVSKTDAFQSVFQDPACNPPDNATISIESRFYRPWSDFFRTHIPDGNVSVDAGNSTAQLDLKMAGSATHVNTNNNSVSTGANVSATVEVLGTELSGTSGPDHKINGPTTFRLVVNGTTKTPWDDADLNDSIDPQEDDLNDPTKGEHHSHSFDRNGGVSISIFATSYGCHDYDPTGVTNTYSGVTYTEERCDNVAGEDIEISSTSNSDNLVILEDGERVPDFSAAGPEQRNLTDILGSKIDNSGFLELAENEFVFLYELSEHNADPANAGTSGDPDYNDAVVLLTITEEGTVGEPENFAIQVSVNEVTVSSS